MKVMTFSNSHFYIRNDIDAGWTLAIWKFRIFFNIRRNQG